MAEEKKSFVLYCDIHSTVKKLSDAQAGQLFKHLLSYVNDEDPDTPEDFAVEIAFEPIKTALKRDLVKYQARKERNRQNGAKGGRPAETEKPIDNPENPVGLKKPDIVIVNDIVIDSDINNDKSLFNSKEYLPFLNNTLYAKSLMESPSWIESIAMQNKIKSEDVINYINAFNIVLFNAQDKKISKPDYAGHFSRWLPSELKKIPVITAKDVPVKLNKML